MTAVAGEEEERGLWMGGHKSLASRPTPLAPSSPFSSGEMALPLPYSSQESGGDSTRFVK